MSKIVTCPVPYYEGTITLPDFVNYEVLCEWGRAARYSMRLLDEFEPYPDGRPHLEYKSSTVDADFRALRIPVILLWVEAWNLKNFPANPTMRTFPATPKKSAFALYEWLRQLASDTIDSEAEEIPNA